MTLFVGGNGCLLRREADAASAPAAKSSLVFEAGMHNVGVAGIANSGCAFTFSRPAFPSRRSGLHRVTSEAVVSDATPRGGGWLCMRKGKHVDGALQEQ